MANNALVLIQDSYTEILKGLNVTICDLIREGLNQIIWPQTNIGLQYWAMLQRFKDAQNGGAPLYIRGYGRNNSKTYLFIDFFKKYYNLNVEPDPASNTIPKQVIEDCTGLTINKHIRNYQISHIFEERTHNPLLFTAPWMICYVPKILDPFTGHECSGYDWVRARFVYFVASKWIDQIILYNNYRNHLFPDLKKNIDNYIQNLKSNPNSNLSSKEIAKFKEDLIYALSPIDIDIETLPRLKRNIYYQLIFH